MADDWDRNEEEENEDVSACFIVVKAVLFFFIVILYDIYYLMYCGNGRRNKIVKSIPFIPTLLIIYLKSTQDTFFLITPKLVIVIPAFNIETR